MNNLNASANLYSGEWCAYRLPCGLCEKLREPCPKQNAINYCYDGAATTGTSTTTVKVNGDK